MQLIDTHQHLILRDDLRYGWTEAVPALAGRDFAPLDYSAEVAGLGVIGSIFMESGVEAACYHDEARLVAGMIGRGGLLGQIASCRPEDDAGFDGWLEQAAALGVLGYRRILHVVPDEVSQSAVFRRNLRKIGQAGLAFDLCFLARQLPLAADLARACDDQVLVLDHCGVPDIAGGGFADWAAGIDVLAALPHLRVKLSGITAYCAPGTASVAVLWPYVDHILQRFGPDRMLWGGDWPVVNLGSGLPGWIDLTRALLAGLSPAEQAAIASGTAREVYRLD